MSKRMHTFQFADAAHQQIEMYAFVLSYNLTRVAKYAYWRFETPHMRPTLAATRPMLAIYTKVALNLPSYQNSITRTLRWTHTSY